MKILVRESKLGRLNKSIVCKTVYPSDIWSSNDRNPTRTGRISIRKTTKSFIDDGIDANYEDVEGED